MSFQMNKTVYLVTDDSKLDFETLYQKLASALQGGVGLLQLREKTASSKTFYEHALAVKPLCQEYQVPLIINDRLDIALAVDADGVHLGQNDLPLSVARKILGPDKIIGISARTTEDALKAEKEGADYLGVGAVFPTSTKEDAQRISEEVFAAIQSAVTIPIVAIGGITLENAATIVNRGVSGIAVVSAILNQRDAKAAAQTLKNLFA
ncbi:thiamine phosphate synthase [Clostridiaceae bacterium 35-E11]